MSIKITFEHKYDRLDKALVSEMDITRSKAQKYIKEGRVYLNNNIMKKSDKKIEEGDIAEINDAEEPIYQVSPTKMDLDIIYEDDDLIVLNKQAGLTVHPGAGAYNDTLVHGLLYHFGDNLSSMAGSDKPGIVHRLDRDTTGLMIVAKNDKAHEILCSDIAERKIKRIYKAFVWGVPKESEGTIITNIDRSRADRRRRAVCRKPKGKTAITHYKLIESWENISLVECKLETGRTHQIRVHMSHIGNSLIGDQMYGNNARKILHNTSGELKDYLDNFTRQALHSYKLEFNHPISGKLLSFEVRLPKDLEHIYMLQNANIQN